MSNIASLSGIAALIGEPTRTAMLVTLMDGRALTAGELATAAGVSPPTASGHLMRLLEAGLLALERQGRHRYYRLSNPAVAAMLEGMMALDTTLADAAVSCRSISTGPRDQALRRARVCYDHLAGEIAVAIADQMAARGEIDFGQDGAMLTDKGSSLLSSLGVELEGRRISKASRYPSFCRPCLDWSERRPHIAGAVGAALYQALLAKSWLRPNTLSRAVTVTPFGTAELKRHFGLVR